MKTTQSLLQSIRSPFSANVGNDGPRAADRVSPRAKHPMLWFVCLYGGGVGVTLVVAMVFHILVFASK